MNDGADSQDDPEREGPEKTSGWRGSRDLWLEAAKQALIESGVDAVKVQPLANRLQIARTSFYWFFKDRNALLAALLADWQAKNTGAFVEACASYAQTIAEAILNLIVVFQDETLFESKLDFAVGGWAHQSHAVAAQDLGEAENRVHRRADLVAHVGQELALGARAGLRSVGPELIKLCRSDGASRWQVLWKVGFPTALPFIFSGMKITITMSVIGIVVGEFIAAERGLGFLILFASSHQQTDLSLAAITVLCALGLSLYGAVAGAEVFMRRTFGDGTSIQETTT